MPEPARERGQVLRGAAAIAVLTMVARLAGFARGVVFVRAVGADPVGDTYARANTVPNILFEAVAGGALASSVVPVLAGAADRAEREHTLRTTAALLTWTVLLLAPVSLAAAVAARPLMGWLTPAKVAGGHDHAVAVGSRMLVVFAPQIVLYGVGVVLTGVLQAHRRFLGPALAPLLSSVVVVSSYLVYAGQTRGGAPTLATLTRGQELVLSVGTTVGVVVLSLSLLVPLRRAGIPLSAGLRFPAGIRTRVVRLALAGVAALVAQQLSVVAVLRLSAGGPAGTLVLYQLAWTAFLVPWAVLAVPLATSAFPRLVVRHESGDGRGAALLAATALRDVLLVSGVAAAVLAAAAHPVARVLALHARGVGDVGLLAGALSAFAPGLLGYGVVATAGRILYAVDAGRLAAAAIVTGWIAVLAADLALSAALDHGHRLLALSWGNSIGMTVAAVGLFTALLFRTRAAVTGIGRRTVAAVACCGLSGVAGRLLSDRLPSGGPWLSAGTATLTGVLVVVIAVGMLVFMSPESIRRRRG